MSDWQGPGHARWADVAGAYVLGALGEDERQGYETHLLECAECRAEVDELLPAVEALPASVTPLEPPPTLRDRLLADVRRESELLAAAGPEADRPPRPRPQPVPRRRWAPRWATTALAGAALAVGLVVGLVVGGGQSTPAARTVALTAAPRLAGAHVRLIIRDGQAQLAADNLAAPPGNRVYQVWLKVPSGAVQPTSSLFVPRADGTATVALPDAAATSREVMVTAEPRGGSAQPTSPPVLTGNL